MSNKRIYHITASLALLLFFTMAFSTNVYSSSSQATGKLKERNPADGRDRDSGRCLFYTGPHGDFLQENEFLLFLIDDEHEDGIELEMTGTFEMDGQRKFKLFPDEDFAEGFLEAVLGDQLDNNVDVVVNRFKAEVVYPRNVIFPQQVAPEELVKCKIRIRGKVVEDGERLGKFKLIFNGSGLHFVDFHGEFLPDEEPEQLLSSSSQVTRNQASCPSPNLTPDGGQFCNTSNCLVDFAGYKWWTLYHYDPAHGYYYNGGLQTIFAPQNVSVDSEGLHLRITRQNLGGGSQWTGAEAVIVQNSDGSQANLGFGTYLVSMKVKSTPSWSQLDPNTALGLFTFQKDKTGDENNPYREIDLAEVSRWGDPCGASPSWLCEGNSQFAIQLWDKPGPGDPRNVHRYTIADNVQDITLVMEWTAAQQPVTFKQYNGSFTLENLPANPDNTFTTTAAQNRFIPDSDCQRFHANFWMGNFGKAVKGLNPGPKNGQPQDVVLTNFQYQPLN